MDNGFHQLHFNESGVVFLFINEERFVGGLNELGLICRVAFVVYNS